MILRQRISPACARRPNLRRHELNKLRIPIVEDTTIIVHISLDRLGKTKIESAVIHADDHIRLARDGDLQQLFEQPFEFSNILQHLRKTDDRMLREIKHLFDACRRHLRSTRAEEAGSKSCPQWLHICRNMLCPRHRLLPQRANEFRREHIAARVARDEHYGKWFQSITSPQRHRDAEDLQVYDTIS